jgi:predicted KAP-like P-loop ATPase
MSISITDKPITSSSEDLLKVNRYTQALVHFIQHSDTPITIGLQGEWGTGKTSLMYMLREELESQNVATSWINTWEYSMFRGASVTTPAVLNGLISKFKYS